MHLFRPGAQVNLEDTTSKQDNTIWSSINVLVCFNLRANLLDWSQKVHIDWLQGAKGARAEAFGCLRSQTM